MVNKISGTATTCQKCSAGKFQEVPGLETCQDCPIGYSQDEVGIPYCVKCSPGEFNDVVDATKCKFCAENTYSSEKGKTSSCESCKIGESSLEGSAKCQKCDAGKYGDGCKNCPVGKFRASDDTQAAVCKNCPLGFIQTNEASTLCIPLVCDAGSYQAKDNIGVCEPCSAGKFQNVKGQQQCETCASGTTPNADATACEPPPWGKCVVGEQYLHDEPANERDKWMCKTLPEGASKIGGVPGCPDSSVPCWSRILEPVFGYQRLTFDDGSFGRCPFEASCNISFRGGCALGHDPNSSELCSQCLGPTSEAPNGYAAQSRGASCEPCPNAGDTGAVFFGAIMLALLLFAFLVWDNLDGAKDMIPIEDENSEDAAATTHNTNMPFHSIVIRIVSSYLQVAGMLLQFDLHLPPSVRTLISVEGSTGSLRYVVCSFIFLIVSRFC